MCFPYIEPEFNRFHHTYERSIEEFTDSVCT